jgi:hypothetical protein
MQNLLILAAAPFLAATLYMSMGRIVIALDARRHSPISPRWLTKIYVLIDTLCVVSQLVGSVLPASGNADLIILSQRIILGGIITQLIALTIFLFTCWRVHRGCRQDPDKVDDVLKPFIRWENHFRAIYLVTVLLILRSIVRSVEYLQGDGGFVVMHEAFIYSCDAALMWLVMVVFLVIHPQRLVRDAKRFKDVSWVGDENVPMRNVVQ